LLFSFRTKGKKTIRHSAEGRHSTYLPYSLISLNTPFAGGDEVLALSSGKGQIILFILLILSNDFFF